MSAITYEELMALPEDKRAEAMAESYSKTNIENKSLRDRLKKENPKAIALYDALKLKFGVDEVDEAFIDQLHQQSSQSMTMEQRLKAMEKTLEAERTKAKQAIEELTSTKKAQTERERDNMILAELSKIGVRGDAMIDAQRIVALESIYDGDTGKWSFDGKDISTYMTGFAKSKPYWIGNPVKNGNGNSSAPNHGNESNADFISEAEYLALTTDQQQTPEIRKKVHASMDRWAK